MPDLREDVKLSVIDACKREAVIILNWTDELDTGSRWNGDGGLMVVLEGEYHQRKSQQILHWVQRLYRSV